MSWSVSAVGRSAAVATAIEQQFQSSSVCVEPEEGVRQAARVTIAAALKAQKADGVVKVEASGSMSRESWPDGPATNQLTIRVEPLYNFLT